MAKNDFREQIAEEFVKALSEDKIPWNRMWASQRAYNVSSGKNYRGINAMWLSYVAGEKGYTDPRWCTFKQASDKGWKIKKGEKSSLVEFWSVYDTKTRKAISFTEMEKILEKEPEREKDMRTIAKKACVFNAAQIEGIPALEQPNRIDIEAVRGQRDTLLQNMGVAFHEGGDQAYYSPSDDAITMPIAGAFESDYAYMSTLLHEAGHATGHESRFNRPLGGGFGSEMYAKEELRAEIASAFTAQALGFGAEQAGLHTSMENHKAYIQSWAKAIKDAPKELFDAIRDAEKISDFLIEKGEFERLPRAQEIREPLEDKIASAEKVKAGQEITSPSKDRDDDFDR